MITIIKKPDRKQVWEGKEDTGNFFDPQLEKHVFVQYLQNEQNATQG